MHHNRKQCLRKHPENKTTSLYAISSGDSLYWRTWGPAETVDTTYARSEPPMFSFCEPKKFAESTGNCIASCPNDYLSLFLQKLAPWLSLGQHLIFLFSWSSS